MKISFFQKKTKDRKVKPFLSGDWYQWEQGGYKERLKESECGGNMYS
jgi:hypothetical protein